MTFSSRSAHHRKKCVAIAAWILLFTVVAFCNPQATAGQSDRPEAARGGQAERPTHKEPVASSDNPDVAIFQRNGNPLSLLGKDQILREIRHAEEKVARIVSIAFWRTELEPIWRSGPYYIFSLALLFLLFQGLAFKLKRLLARIRLTAFFQTWHWQRLAMRLIERSLLISTSILFVYAAAGSGRFLVQFPIIRTAVYLLTVVLMTRWGFVAISHFASAYPRFFPSGRLRQFKLLLSLVRGFGILYALGLVVLGKDSVILLLVRLLFEICLIFWTIQFWKGLGRNGRVAAENGRWLKIVCWLGFGIVIGGFALELSGFAFLAHHWYVSWGRTVAVLLWVVIGLCVLRERDFINSARKKERSGEDPQTAYAVSWFLIRIGVIGWLVVGLVTVMVAWGGRKAVFAAAIHWLGRPVQIGNMHFSLAGILYAGVALLLTHAAVRVWRYFFSQKILQKSGIETGLQESVVSITVYLIWGIGILLALHVFGLNATSLAVVFGAVGIGLGFGLQNIFNNFVSGIILLFERPIQVGDDLEINGLWATVKKINVRSTVVQTYDNASLIIPNSELISKQVTNWSFKDKRLRRKITVGVAYGSDIDLVRTTLLEIAEKTPNVLKYPKADVLFTDFGDSALIFVLRLWTMIDHMLTVDTQVRFEIDRLFKERGITIAFPQRDIHVHFPEGAPGKKLSTDAGS